MKIAMVSTFPPQACGVGEFAERLCAGYEALGHQVARFAETGLSGNEAPSNAMGHFNRHMLDPIQLATQINDFNPDLIEFQHEFGIWPDSTKFEELMLRCNAPIFVTLHTVKRIGHQGFKRALVASARRTFVQSQAMQCAWPFTTVLRHPTPVLQGHNTIAAFNVPTFVTPGFISRGKALDVTLRALARVTYPFRWIVAGQADREFLVDLQTEVQRLGMMDSVRIVPEYLDHAGRSALIDAASLIILNSQPTLRPIDTPLSISGAARDAIAMRKPTASPTLPIYDDLTPEIGAKFPPADDAVLAEILESKFWGDSAWHGAASQVFDRLGAWSYGDAAAFRLNYL